MGYITRSKAQRILGCDKETIVKLLLSGEIESSRKENNAWLVSEESLQKFLETKWSEYTSDPIKLQGIILRLKEKIRGLEELLKENGISYSEKEPDKLTLVELGFKERTLRVLYSYDIRTIEQLTEMTKDDLLQLKGCGSDTYGEIWKRLVENGLKLKEK